jgi:hypothetical protein
MKNNSVIEEKHLHQIWLNQDFVNDLNTSDGESVSVINPGEYNTDSGGPDFKHARIKIGRLTFVGDVEIDRDYSDWKNHGHNINRNYNKVILHLSYSNKQKQHYVYTSDGRKVNSIPLLENISADNLKAEITLAGKTNKSVNSFELKCRSEIDLVPKEDRQNAILNFGISRFQNKCERVFHRLKELKFISQLELKEPVIRYELSKEFMEREFSHDDFKDKNIWKQLFYELIFEALGYSKNKNIMMKLAQNVNLDFLNQLDKNNELNIQIESVLFNISGLMPEINSLNDSNLEYLQKLDEYWKLLSKIYDGKKFDETQWQFLGQRPQNFPTVRISGGAKILEAILIKNLTGNVIKKFSEIHSTKVLINSIRSLFIVKASGYWREHYVFDKSSKIKLNYIIGLSRADEIFINVILPYLSVYFDMFGNEALSKKVLKVYNEYNQKVDNKIVRNVSDALKLDGVNKKTIYSQGMIEVFRNYCSKNKCLECEIGKKIFI